MSEYGVLDPNFWWKLLALVVIILLLWMAFSAILRKLLKVEREKLFSYNHVNEKHKKVDWIIRIAAGVIMIIGYAINSMRDPSEWFWFLQAWFILMLLVIISQIAKAVIERKYAQNPNAFKVTISEVVFIVVLFISLFTTDFWGLG